MANSFAADIAEVYDRTGQLGIGVAHDRRSHRLMAQWSHAPISLEFATLA